MKGDKYQNFERTKYARWVADDIAAIGSELGDRG
jgi:hypothetical protein